MTFRVTIHQREISTKTCTSHCQSHCAKDPVQQGDTD
jgi:hypothetical protein